MDRPTLTIGMATYDDYDGCWATLMALRAHNALTPEDEILVVDNNPGSAHGMQLRDLCQKWKANVKYVPFSEAVGTSAPRDRVFTEASGDVVACVDCHIMLATRHGDRLLDPIAAMREFYADPEHEKDMLCGVILNDNGTVLGTQFNDVWRSEMWGVWGTAWQCPCGADNPGESLAFTPVQVGDDGLVYRHTVSQVQVSGCSRCGRALPAIGWPGHEQALLLAGYHWHGLTPDGDPFEVLGQGLGMFAMRRSAWPGFNPHARGFGGEELYVHAKVRAAGGRVFCHPSIRWYHRFGRPGGVPYRADRYAKVRNYVLEFQEMDWSLTPIKDHWVATGLMPAAEWEHLLADPVKHVRPAGHRAGPEPIDNPRRRFDVPDDPNQPPDTAHNLDTLYAWAAGRKRDLEQHAPKIKEFSSQARHVTAIVKRREWDAFLLAGRPDDLVTYTTERDQLHSTLMRTVERTETNPDVKRRLKHYTVHSSKGLEWLHEIEDTDLLVLDTVHHASQLTAELTAYAPRVRRRIMIRGTQAFGEKAENQTGPGLLVALRAFMRANPEWSVIYHSPAQYGLTVISRDPDDKPTLPGVVTLAANFAKAIAEHVADGLTKVTAEQLEARLAVCTLCDQRNGERCAVCGCFQQPKAAMRSSECPLGRWPELEADEPKTWEVPG